MDAPRGFSRYLGIAERFLARGRVPALLIAVARKRSRLKLVKSDLRLLQELLVAWVRGEYRGLSRQALLSVIAALAYFLSPVDIVPDFIFCRPARRSRRPGLGSASLAGRAGCLQGLA